MGEHGPLAAAYVEAAERFSSGDVDGWGSLLADDCVFEGSRGRVGSTASEIVANVKAVRSAVGWSTHEILASAEAGDVVSLLARNTYADGSHAFAAGGVRFEAGKVVEMRAIGGIPDHLLDRLRR